MSNTNGSAPTEGDAMLPGAVPPSRPESPAPALPTPVPPDGAAAAPPPLSFPIVGIGASAGGLAAFDAFLSAIPTERATGIAYVLVQHLSPDHKSVLSDLCQRHTRIPVMEVTDGLLVLPNRIYIIPPNHDMALLDGRLHLLEPAAPRGLRLPIDFFFRSLAQDRQERAIAVVLSGTGSDGTLGARAVKGAGGLVMAQLPESAAYDGMPRSVIATGLTDFILAPAQMPAQLVAYVEHAFGLLPRPVAVPVAPFEEALKRVCILLRDKTGHDFSQYKESTLLRRIERRMALHQIEQQGDYVLYLQQDQEEAQALFRDLLIGVTNFFRDPEAFAALQEQVIPRLFADKPTGAAVRVWVCGCSTGEEAYSIAILLHEYQETLQQTYRVQVFATDLDARAIAQARLGVYPASIAADLSAERLGRYFFQVGQDGAYRVQKVVRDLLVFSEHDLIKDPPFSRLDLISCRNLLIYMNADLQGKVLPLFHYALMPAGALFLGTSETVGDSLLRFPVLNQKWKIYLRQGADRGTPAQTLNTFLPPARMIRGPAAGPTPEERRDPPADPGTLTEQTLVRHYAPIGILINTRGEILHIHGRTGQYLEPAPGDAAMNILAMAREGLRRPLTSALHRAVAHQEVVRFPGLSVRTNGDRVTVDLTVRPAESPRSGIPLTELFLVVREPVAAAVAPARDAGAGAPLVGASLPGALLMADADAAEPAAHIAMLEQELRSKEEYLQSTLEEMETANEELTSTNEEMQSINEELQSTNEELETSKEELQSLNEELATVNAELQTKVADLSQVNDDMNNLLAGTGVATLFLDQRLRITRFTPASTQLIKLIHTDIGRPVGDITSNLVDYDGLEQDARAVLASLVPQERQVKTRVGTWHLLHIRPYRTLANVIEGVVITFQDITRRKQLEDALGEARAYAEAMADARREALVVLDQGLRVCFANSNFYRLCGLTPEATEGRPWRELAGGAWDLPELAGLIARVQAEGQRVDDYQVIQAFPLIGRRALMLNVRRVSPAPERPGGILIAIHDLTDPGAAGAGPDGGANPRLPGGGEAREDPHERAD